MNSKILSLDEAKAKGLVGNPLSVNPTEKNLFVLGDLVHPRFSEFGVLTSENEISDFMKVLHHKTDRECRETWGLILRNLYKYSKEELNVHYEMKDADWQNWCDDCVLWYCYNARVFKKAIPVVMYNPAIHRA